ncbi:unnamed protein product [Adineta steineri]|uniref:Secreted protein n=1 Tax=Adineta steineri TaxID=433720 RepID=A0A815TKY0_9BILA|nr:unnamed protein product [Adineta steineri]CAF4144743.1 unnamed protein product [Adineta steineri]
MIAPTSLCSIACCRVALSTCIVCLDDTNNNALAHCSRPGYGYYFLYYRGTCGDGFFGTGYCPRRQNVG